MMSKRGAEPVADSAPLPTLVLAGARPGHDPLLAGTGLATKALLPIARRPMLAHVLAALDLAPAVGRVTVVAQNTEPLAQHPGLAGAADRVRFIDSPGSIADAVAGALAETGGPLLVTTADNVLLTPSMLTEFVAEASGADVAVAMVERRALVEAGHSSKRTWLRFLGGAWSGANLFYVSGPHVLPLVEFWRALEQERKKARKIAGAFGPGLLLLAMLRLIDIHRFADRAARRFGLSAKIVAMREAEACIDADKPADLPVIEAILAARQA